MTLIDTSITHPCQQCSRPVAWSDIHIMERRADGRHRYWHEHCWDSRGISETTGRPRGASHET